MKKIGLIFMFLLSFQLVFSQEKEVNFEADYIKTNQGNTTIEINEMQELVYLILALTETANNPNIINQTTSYYQEVAANFKTFSSHGIVKAFDEELKTNIVNFILLPANAYGFKFEGEKIVRTNVYIFPAKGIGKFEVKENPILNYIDQLEDFSKKTKFRAFYQAHKTYYDSLKTEYKNFADIEKQRSWLEQKFDTTIHSYRVLTSPLMGAINATHTFEDNEFKEILLFLPTIRSDKDWSELYKKAMNTRIIFTEIDHNYVGPVSEKNTEKINSIFDHRQIWVDANNKGTGHYPNPIKIFDEYLTWGLYVLYAYDTFGNESEVFEQTIRNVNEVMVNKRGFIKFKAFNEFLLQLYQNNKEKKIEMLYPQLLDWSSKQL
ncbi:DUF4932 domain-containing protein [Empedobacter brevis]|uniref:DUF4932 domain-containing protein n=1 Tax=Empedobacter brevis NBRC 14943 = ATCC 43319 TaxID=1218108 RepID=A0A511NGJ5_9FLAO|nr:DUF4932 domain-containing protein [Empedobacter brevis]GEM51935.1 hypothetical protein EB1_17250 [Empedobacter brevis NBRC 14943 = ATCC 43319]